MKKDLAVNIENYTQYINLAPGIDSLISKGYSVDVYIPHTEYAGFKDMWNNFDLYLKETNKYTIYNESRDDISYRVWLEPYPMSIRHNADYRIRYRYSNISAKPNIVYKPEKLLCYDAVLCSGEYDANFLSVFSTPHITGNLKYKGFKKLSNEEIIKKYDKPVLLYLPTYGDCSSIDLVCDALNKLRDKYYIVAKLHHGTNYLEEEQHRILKLKQCVDELMEYSFDLSELFTYTSVVLTDNSGAIFDALYAEVPVAVCCDDIDKNRIEDFHSIQHELVEQGVLPYSSKCEDIEWLIQQALTDTIIEKQTAWNRKNFYHSDTPEDAFVKTLEDYITNKVNHRRIAIHRVVSHDYYNKLEQLDSLRTQRDNEIAQRDNEIAQRDNEIAQRDNEIAQRDNEIAFLKSQLSYYEKGKLYKIAKLLYRLKGTK